MERPFVRLVLGSFVGCMLVTGAHAQWSNVTVVYPPMQPPPPSVVIVRERPAPTPAEFEATVSPITYLIAFKNSVVRLANQYWVKGDTLYYVTAAHQQMTAPLYSVDRTLSQQLNSEQNVAFSLPSEQEKTIVQTHVIRTTATSVHKRCFCTTVSRGSGRASRAAAK